MAEARELKNGVDGGFEGAGVALNLGEDEAALECGEEGDGEVVRVGAVREVPGGVQTAAASMILARVRSPLAVSSAGTDRQFTSPDPLEVVEGVDDLLGFGAGAVVGVDVDPPDGAAGVEDDGGGHRQGDGAVGVDAGQVESEVQLGGAGLG